MSNEPTIADLVDAMPPDRRAEFEAIARRIARAMNPPAPEPAPRPKRRPRPVTALPPEASPEEIARVRKAIEGR